MDEDAPKSEITQLLEAWQRGDAAAAKKLFPLIYDELRVIARRQLARGRSNTLQTTAVVHEAYLKLIESSRLRFADRSHFYAVASKAMRQILVDHARRGAAQKRGGGRARVDFDEERIPIEERAAELLEVDEALSLLEEVDPHLARVVEMRFFAGLSVDETAEAVGSSPSTVKRDWNKARAFLYRELDAGRGSNR